MKIIKNVFLLFLGLELTALGTVLLKIGNLGMNSLSTLPAVVCELFPFISFGTSNLLVMILSIVVLVCIVRKVKLDYILCFVSSIIYSMLVDMTGSFLSWQISNLQIRIIFFVIGMILVSLGIYFQKETELPSTPFNIFCKEVAIYMKKPFSTLKAILDISFVSITLIIEFIIGNYDYVGVGTIICALFVSRLIKMYQNFFHFKNENHPVNC